MNVCTDQLAMLLAAPGQLVSVSYLSRDPSASAMVEEAGRLPVNRGLAEEIFLLKPDVVLTGAYANRATVGMLQRLGVPVEVFQPENDIGDIRANMMRMGEVLGREAEAREMVAAFDAELALLQDAPAEGRPRAALYAANGYSSGSRTLAGHIVALAGFDNVADELGLEWGGVLPLEVLLMSQPDLIVQGQGHPGTSRAEEPLDHPALRKAMGGAGPAVMSDPDWVCGTPSILKAVSQLRDARIALERK